MTYAPLGKDDIQRKIEELQNRLAAMGAREKAVDDLKEWMAERHLGPTDLLWMYRQMAPTRATRAVKSKLPLRPGNGLHPSVAQIRGERVVKEHGREVPKRGDPEFRRAIKEARVARGLSSKTLGKEIGVSDASVSHYEQGRYMPKEDVRVKLLAALKLPPDLGKAAVAASAAAQRHGKAGPEFGAAIRAAREGKQLHAREVGALIGVTSSTILGWEAGRYGPRDDATRVKVLKALGLPEIIGAAPPPGA